MRRVVGVGFAVRLGALVFILSVGQTFSDPYFISDDIAYERIGLRYMSIATAPVDIRAFNSAGAGGALEPFWFWVVCVSAYVLKTVYASRFINIALSSTIIILVYLLTKEISSRSDASLLAARLYAYLPLSVLTCCFCIKDIFLTFAVFVIFYLFVRFQNSKKIPLPWFIFAAALAVAVYYTRGAVVELLAIFFFVYVVHRFWKAKSYFALLICVLAGLVFFYFASNSIMDSFSTKIDDYSDYSLMGASINSLQVQSIWQIYKLPFSYFFATLQPVVTNLFAVSDTSSFWSVVLGYLNLTLVPVAIGNFAYIFCHKENLVFWASTAIMYCAIITLVLGIYRHYLFLLPVEMINFALFVTSKGEGAKKGVLLASVGYFLLIVLISFGSVL